MSMVAKKAPYTLFIVDDTNIESPREDKDNFGTMACWHKKYNLGDKNDYSNPSELFRELVRDVLPAQEVIDYVLTGKASNLKLEFDKVENEWNLMYYYSHYKEWHTEEHYYESMEGQEYEVCEGILDNLEDNDLKTLAERCNLLIPLYCYDHSGITISTSRFSCPWDSGQVGWIYATYEDIKKEYGDTTPENIEKARATLQGEVEEYDLYLTGQCYGFKLFDGKNEILACWGLLCDIADVSKRIAEHLPDDCKDMVNSLEIQSASLDEDEYLAPENEDEEDLER